MAQTPLHVSAGYGKVDIVKLLLEWKGPEKVELEAKNMVRQGLQRIELRTKFLLLSLLFDLVIIPGVFCSMGRLPCIWQRRTVAMKLQSCSFLMVLL